MVDLKIENNDLFSISIFGIISGIILFFQGFRLLWKKRLIQNTPSSSISSLATGIVELYARAETDTLLKSPFAKVECLYFRSVQEHLVRGSKGNKWKIEMDFRSDTPFLLNDGTGTILVDPVGAETDLMIRYSQQDGDRRYREYYLLPGEFLYVLGTARPLETIDDFFHREKERKLAELYEDAEKKASLDLNGDGWIDEREWKIAHESIDREVVEKYLNVKEEEERKNINLTSSRKLILGKGGAEGLFLISFRNESELTGLFHKKSILFIWGGAILFLFSLALFLYNLSHSIH